MKLKSVTVLVENAPSVSDYFTCYMKACAYVALMGLTYKAIEYVKELDHWNFITKAE
jgi:hypothetical protein